ncbi:MAG: Flagellar hook-basal body complex protein FliE [Pseudomonadota bacterium]|jgi:flagellar hook-basal body complex protein FliE
MIDRINSTANIESMLKTMRNVAAQASGELPQVQDFNAQTERVKSPTFVNMVQSAVEQVNGLQTKSSQMQAAYERGEEIPLTDVVLSMQKSSLAFETTLQVRNKVLRAYEDILSMPV